MFTCDECISCRMWCYIQPCRGQICRNYFPMITTGRYCGAAVSLYPNERRQIMCASGPTWDFLNCQFVIYYGNEKYNTESRRWVQCEVSSFPAKLGNIKKYSKSKEYFLFKQHLLLWPQPQLTAFVQKHFPSIHTNPCERFLFLFFFFWIVTREIQIWSSLRPKK